VKYWRDKRCIDDFRTIIQNYGDILNWYDQDVLKLRIVNFVAALLRKLKLKSPNTTYAFMDIAPLN